jgi:hypothetical protein
MAETPTPAPSNPSWERVLLARHPKRPHTLDYIQRNSPRSVHIVAIDPQTKSIELKGSAALGKTKTTQAIVEITTRKGERLRYHTTAVRGSATNPMTRKDVAGKARGLLAPTLGERRAKQLIDTIWNLERVPDLRQLHFLLRPQ